MNNAKIFLISVVLPKVVLGVTVQQQTSGPCSPAITNVKGDVTIQCLGLNVAQQKMLQKIPDFLDKLLEKQADPNQINAKLDEILNIDRHIADMQSRNEPRRLDRNAKTLIREQLSRYPGQRFSIASPSNSHESFEFGREIQEVLESAGWKVQDPALGRLLVSGEPETGVMVEVSSVTAAALSVLDSIHNAGIKVKGRQKNSISSSLIQVYVFPQN